MEISTYELRRDARADRNLHQRAVRYSTVGSQTIH
jgi:hypothetical protein